MHVLLNLNLQTSFGTPRHELVSLLHALSVLSACTIVTFFPLFECTRQSTAIVRVNNIVCIINKDAVAAILHVHCPASAPDHIEFCSTHTPDVRNRVDRWFLN